MKKLFYLTLLVPVAVLLWLIGYDVHEYLWSRYGVMPMRKIK